MLIRSAREGGFWFATNMFHYAFNRSTPLPYMEGNFQHLIIHLCKPSVRFTYTNLPLAEFTATEIPSIGLSELPFFTKPTIKLNREKKKICP